jgi:hypothetical protein
VTTDTTDDGAAGDRAVGERVAGAPDVAAYLPATRPPAPLRVLRVVLFAAAGLTVLVVLAFLLSTPLTGEAVGRAIWTVWPGVAAFLLAARLDRPSRRTYWLVVGLGVVYVLLSLATVGNGDPRGITNLALPAAILVLVTRRSSRGFLLGS